MSLFFSMLQFNLDYKSFSKQIFKKKHEEGSY